MKLQLSKLTLLPMILLLSACESLPQSSHIGSEKNNPIVVLPIATAVQVDYQDEVKLFRLTQLITEHKGNNKQKALLLYERGIIYDRMGLVAHSRYDFTQAINADPSFPEAYNSLGIYLLLEQSYDKAFDAFDSAIELSQKMQYSYLHRAIGLYHVKRYPLASRDINKFYQMDSSDPYRTLWRYIIDSKMNDENALTALKNAQISESHYAAQIIDVIAGRTSEKDFFANIGSDAMTNKEIAQRLCEAYFYLGHWHKLSGNLNKAIYYFRLTTTTNIHEFIEYKYALIELTSIQQEIQDKIENNVN